MENRTYFEIHRRDSTGQFCVARTNLPNLDCVRSEKELMFAENPKSELKVFEIKIKEIT